MLSFWEKLHIINKVNASTDFPCKKTTEEVSMSVTYKICLYHIKPPYSNSLSWIRMSTACNVVILEGGIGTNGIVLTKMVSESTICVLKTCFVVLKSLSKSLKKLRLRKCGWMVKIHHLMQIISNVHASFSTELQKNVLSDFWRLSAVNKPNLLSFYKNILRGFRCMYWGWLQCGL